MKRYNIKDLYIVKLGKRKSYQVVPDSNKDFYIAYGKRDHLLHNTFTLITKGGIELTNQRINVGEGGKMLSLAVPLAFYADSPRINKEKLTEDEIKELEKDINANCKQSSKQQTPSPENIAPQEQTEYKDILDEYYRE